MVYKDLLERVIRKEDLTEEEAAFIMEEIMNGLLTPAQISAFLVALRMKGESVDEITGFAKIMRRRVYTVESKHPVLVDTCGTGGDGAKTFNISTIAAFVVAGAGIPVVKHGNVAVSSLCGSADLLKGLGVKVDADRSFMEKALNEIGICFLFAPLYHHAMKHAALPRKEIGVRTVFNILGPLANPAKAQAQLLGVYKKELTEVMAHVLLKLGTKQAFVVHGKDGLDEVSTTGKTYVTHLKNGKIESFVITPEWLKVQKSSLDALKGGNLETNLKITRSILEGKKGPQRDIVLVNAAFAIMAGKGAPDLEKALKKAVESIDSGKAAQKLRALVEYTTV
jgi:anthranilate phosphoribosyltransferase